MLGCYVIGEDNAFVIEIDKFKTISQLRDAIKVYKKNVFKTLDANQLILWKVDVPVTKKREINADTNIAQVFGAVELKEDFDTIEDYFGTNPTAKNIHVIVQPPPPITTVLDQRRANCADDIAALGYLPRQGGLGGTWIPSDLRLSSTNEGVSINDPDISLRFDIIPSLIKDLIDKKVILVQAPPFSGKTSIAQILEYSLVNTPEFSNYRIIRISLLWKLGVSWNTFGDRWKSIVGISWKEWIDQCDLIPTILIIDEAQLIYEEEKKVNENNKETAAQFWIIVKGALQEMTNIKIIMFAAYKYRSSNHTGFTTPGKLPELNCKILADISFTNNELKDYIKNYFENLDPQSVLKLCKYIQEVTKGHAGLVCHILKSTKDAQIDTSCLTWEKFFKYLNSESFNSSVYANCRAVPEGSVLSIKQKAICEQVYLRGRIRYVDSNEDAVYLIKSGILHTIDNTHITFAAPLFRRLFFQQYYDFNNISETTTIDLYHFIVKIFTAMCNELRGSILRRTLGIDKEFMKEFYRIGTKVLGNDHFLSYDVGSVFGHEGKIDFYVDKLDWGIEFVRNTEGMIKYHAKSVAIIDVNYYKTKKVQKMKKDFIYVSLSENYGAFMIESLGKEPVIIEFQRQM